MTRQSLAFFLFFIALVSPALARPRRPPSPPTTQPNPAPPTAAPPAPTAPSDDKSAQARKQKWDEAATLLGDAHAARPGDLDVLENLVLACFRSPRCAPRRAVILREALAKLRNAPDLLRELAEQAEHSARDQKWEDALGILDVLRAQADVPSLLEDQLDACLHVPACAPRRLALLREGVAKLPEPAELVDDYTSALIQSTPARTATTELIAFGAHHPNDDRIQEALIDVAVDHDLHELALEELPRWLARHPADVERRVAYAEALRESHHDREYEAKLDELTKAYPNHPLVLALRIEALIERGDLRTARRELERLRRLATSKEDTERVHELEKDLHDETQSQRREFRRDAAWNDLADDLEREQDRDP